MLTPMFKVVSCHRCSALYRPVNPNPTDGPRSRPSALTNGRRLCPECRRLLGNLPDQQSSSAERHWKAAETFSGETRQLITSLKYRNCTAAVAVLADQLVRAIRTDSLDNASRHGGESADTEFDVVTWAPTSDRRRRRRGFDQSELLARAVARGLGLPCRRLLFRDRSRHQTGRSRHERLEQGPVFTARPLRRPSRVLVIDDVVTTGSTLRAAGHALDLAGAAKVVLFAAASTPEEIPPKSTKRSMENRRPTGRQVA